MGHARVDNLSRLIVKQIYAKGKVSIEDLMRFAEKKDEGLHAGEAYYNKAEDFDVESGIVHLGIEECLRWFEKNRVIEPVFLDEEQKRIYGLRQKEYLESFYHWVRYNKILWKFAEGARQLYLDDRIDHLHQIEN